uniref:ANK_REP_REGION domain-containing protein n=1 Tax=Panagrellus redivivus TaxID=6233 RepID=A0A7E4VGI4_PANRE
MTTTAPDFNRLAAFVVDADYSAIEKELATVRALADVKNALGQSLLFVAVTADRHRVLDILVKRGLRLSETDKYGRSLLHWAVKFSAFSCLKYLLDPKFDNHVLLGDHSKVTPLHLAVQHKRAKILRILLNALPEDTELYKVTDTYGRTPLHYAAHFGSLEAVVELLNDDRLAVDQRDSFQQIPLMYAVSSNFLTSADVVRILSQKKPMSTTNTRNNLGQTAFHLAVLANNLEAISIMLQESEGRAAAVAVSFDHRCRTPLHYAGAMGRVEAAKLLIANGARNDTLDNYGASAAHYAAQTCVKTLEAILNASGSGG